MFMFVSCLQKEKPKERIETACEDTVITADSNKEVEIPNISDYTSLLHNWLEYYNYDSLCLANFSFQKSENLPNLFANLDSSNVILDIYEQFYKYSPDNSKILDLVSYNLCIKRNENNELIACGISTDSEVSIRDINNLIWQRILFVGPNHVIEDGFWINNHQLIIVGHLCDTSPKTCKPQLWFVDLVTKQLIVFDYNFYIKNVNCDYLEKVRYKNVKQQEF